MHQHKTPKSEGLRESQAMSVTPGERHQMIAVAAYFRAESRGFAPGGEQRDWYQAELEIDKLIDNMAWRGATRSDYERVGLRNALRLWT